MKRVEAENIAQKVVELLENERVKRNITKTEINNKTGLCRTAWTLVVSKKNSPTLQTLLMVADVIGIDLKKLLLKQKITNKAL